jgi:hypothetical protein
MKFSTKVPRPQKISISSAWKIKTPFYGEILNLFNEINLMLRKSDFKKRSPKYILKTTYENATIFENDVLSVKTISTNKMNQIQY